jgi:predicted  nucleic acid-binding Zn-ribbon protein
MEEKTPDFEEETTSIVKIEDMTVDETQLAEQLYYNAGLNPIVDAGIRDYDKKIQQEDKLINKVFGPRGTDIRGYSESVAKRVALAVFGVLNKQYGGKVGDMRSYIMSLEDDRDRANLRYDELMGRVIGILGDEYKELRTDSKEFIEKLTKTLGDDLKDAKIDQKALAERLANIDGLRSQITNLNKEKEQAKEKYEAQITELKSDHKEEIRNLKLQIDTLKKEKELEKGKYEAETTELDLRIKALETDKNNLTNDLGQLRKDYNEFKTAISKLSEDIPGEDMGKKFGEDLYKFVLKDSKVPSAVLMGVGQFVDFKKYLGLAAESGAKEVSTRIQKILTTTKSE